MSVPDNKIIRVIDVETSGLVAPEAEIMEIGWTDVLVSPEGKPLSIGRPRSLLFSTERPCPPEVRAVHHIAPAEVLDRPVCKPADLRSLTEDTGLVAFAAHASAFEAQWFTAEILAPYPLLCTMKAASRVWPDAPNHQNSTLRYWRCLPTEDQHAMPPHRAGPDSYVTAHILADLLHHASVGEMVAWTAEPRVMPRITFGKHRGAEWSDVDAGYLAWVCDKSDLDADAKWNARRELDRRAGR